MQVSVVEDVSSGEMLLQTGEAVMGIMKEFQVLPALTFVARAAIPWCKLGAGPILSVTQAATAS